VAFLSIQKVSKGYAGKLCLKNVTFQVEKGDLLTVVGPSGAGKTTLLRLIDRLEEPDAGELSLDGKGYTSLAPQNIRSKIGMVFQNPVLFNTTVFNNIAYSLRFRGLPEEDTLRRVNSILDVLRLSDTKERRALTLSGGEAQRVSLARSLVYEPQLLLLDEPTANLDPYNVSIIEEVLTNSNRENDTTIIVVTHNIFQAKRIAKKVAFILNGELVEYGNTEEFFNNAQDQRTRSFIRGEMVC